MKILQRGDKGNEVKELQQALIKLGYSVGIFGADGKFGSATEKALKKYQQEHDEEATGILDNDTWADIEIDLDILQKEEDRKKADKAAAEAAVVKPAKTYSTVMIGGASSDENRSAKGGQAGNQNGKELKIQKWYNGNWDTVLRPKTAELAEALAVQCEGACGNMNIGYDQNERNTILPAAKAANWILANINTPCECDCSSLMSVCCICCGMSEEIFYEKRNLRTTKTIVTACKKTGKFDVLKDTEYLTSKDYLKRGDILVAAGSHTCMVLQNGSKAAKSIAGTTSTVVDKIKEIFVPSTGYTGEVTGGSVNIRKGPGTNYKVVKIAHRGDKFNIVEEKDGWGRINADTDKWISLKYIKKV